MADIKFNGFKEALAKAGVNLQTDNIKVMLVDNTYVPDPDNHIYRSHVTGEVTGDGYIAGGKSLLNKAVSLDLVNDLAKFDADDLVWGASTLTAKGAILYKDTGNATSDLLIIYIDFGTDQSSQSGDFTVAWNASGILTIA